MFKSLRETIISLNSDVKSVTNCERAKKLRKKLLAIGLILAIVGLAGVIACFVLLATAGLGAFTETGFSARMIVPFVCVIPSALIASVGAIIARLGFQIVVVGYTTDVVDEVVGNNCPKCGSKIEIGENYCSKCGGQTKKVCEHCGEVNGLKNEFCTKCGEKL